MAGRRAAWHKYNISHLPLPWGWVAIDMGRTARKTFSGLTSQGIPRYLLLKGCPDYFTTARFPETDGEGQNNQGNIP